MHPVPQVPGHPTAEIQTCDMNQHTLIANPPRSSSTTSQQPSTTTVAQRKEDFLTYRDCRTELPSPIHRYSSVNIQSPTPVRDAFPAASTLNRIDSILQARESQSRFTYPQLRYAHDAESSDTAGIVQRPLCRASLLRSPCDITSPIHRSALRSPIIQTDSLAFVPILTAEVTNPEEEAAASGYSIDHDHDIQDSVMADSIDRAFEHLDRLLRQQTKERPSTSDLWFQNAQARATDQVGQLRQLALRSEPGPHSANPGSSDYLLATKSSFREDSVDAYTSGSLTGGFLGRTPSPDGPLYKDPGYPSSPSTNGRSENESILDRKGKKKEDERDTVAEMMSPSRRRSPTCAWWKPAFLARRQR